MRLAVVKLFLLLVVSPALAADLPAKLVPLSQPDEKVFPYGQAELTLTNATPSAIDTIFLHPDGGGPKMKVALTVPPGQQVKRVVALPAFWPSQRYVISALDSAGASVGAGSAVIDWPAESVTTDTFVNDSYLAWRSQKAHWPAQTRTQTVILLAVFVATLAGTLLIRRAWRAIIAALLAVAGGAAAYAIYASQDPIQAQQFFLVRYGAAPGPTSTASVPATSLPATNEVAGKSTSSAQPEVESFAILCARRTAELTWQTASPPYVVYPDRSAVAGSQPVVDVAARTLELELRPGQVRVVRPARLEYRPPVDEVSGTYARTGQNIEVNAQFPHRRAILVGEDSFWPVSTEPGPLAMSVRANQSSPLWRLLAGYDDLRLEEPQLRLLAYWRDKHSRPDRVYLLNFNLTANDCRLEVLELDRR